MPTSGIDVYRTIISAAEDSKADLLAKRAKQSKTAELLEGLASERGEAFVELAEHYLPTLNHETVRKTWHEVRSDIKNVLLRKEDRQSALGSLQQQLEEQLVDLQQRLADRNDTLSQLTQQRDDLARQLSEQLSDDPNFQKLTDEAAVAEISLERAEASMAEVERDVIEKLPDYEHSRLFQYLYQRGMGTPTYRARGIRRRLDHWVSKMIDFPRTRKSYEFLNQVPDKMRELIAERRSQLNEIMQRLEAIQAEVATQLGLDVVLNEIHEQEIQREAGLTEIECTQQRIGDTIEELDAIADSDGPFYKEAITKFQSLLSQTETYALESRAIRSPETEDDQLVARIKHLESEIAQVRKEADDLRGEVHESEDHLEAISYLAQRFQRANFDHGRSYFDDELDIRDSLDRLADGREDPDLLWNQIRRRQHMAPSWYEKNARRVSNAATSPMGQILMQTMAHAAGAAMRDYARRAGQRRAGQPSGNRATNSRNPSGNASRRRQPTPRPKRRPGFSNRRSF